jgi:transposase
MDIANLLDSPLTPPQAPQTPPPPSTPLRTHQTTRDQRLQVQTLRDAGLTYNEIHQQLDLTFRQIQHAISHRVTPKKRKGRPSLLTQEEIDEIIAWICESKANRRTPWAQIPVLMGLNVSFYCIRTALRRAGFSRRVARHKPPISERNRQARLR